MESLFIPFGPIIEVVMGKGFAEVQFESDEDALAAIDNLDGSQVFGQTLKVRRAKKETASLDSATPGKLNHRSLLRQILTIIVWNQETYLQNTE